jgi:tetratricopeptide (TPR) repeat protein
VCLETNLKIMAIPDHSGENPDNPRGPAQSEGNSASMNALLRALEAFQRGVSANNAEQVEAAALDALAVAAEEAEQNPTPALQSKQEAAEREAHGDWAGAEACYRKVLALEELTGNAGLVCKAHYDLSRLFLLIGDLDRADACARAATAAARQANVFPVLVMALENQAMCALRRSDHAGALAAASEAVTAVEPGRMHDGIRAGAWVTRARCRMASGDLAGAESDLAACKPILLDHKISPIFAGFHSRAAGWWEVTAESRTRNGDVRDACEAWAEAAKCRRHVASLPQVSGPYTLAALARALRRLGEGFEAAGKPEESKATMAEALRIWCELGLPEQGLR